VLPESGVNPRATNGYQNVASVAVTVKSEARASWAPIPTAQPRTAQQVVDLIAKRGAPFSRDVGDEEQCAALVDPAVAEFGRLDILVNNAGIVRDKVIWNMSAADFDAVMRVRVRGTWLTPSGPAV
jgi:NAD(P)-dependent dehydrogenase (short-subunit alcohol dehydrogenase family)